jgi:hypothetical protein
MSDPYPYTLRLLRGRDGKWGWVVLNRRNPEALIHPEDVVEASASRSFATAEEAMLDARTKFGGEPSPDARNYKVWVEDSKDG